MCKMWPDVPCASRSCRYTSLRDLLRVVRNKRTHFYEMPPETQAQMGPLPDGFLRCALLTRESVLNKAQVAQIFITV